MRIAQIAPLAESVPPKLYGGTERIVSYLTEELVRGGHEVTLFASGDSVTGADLVPITPQALRLDPHTVFDLPHLLVLMEQVRRRADQFDVLHFHTDLIQGPLVHEFAHRTVTTLHGRLDLPDLLPYYQVFNDLPLVSISDYQRRPMPPVNWAGTVYHGLPADLLPPNLRPQGDYLAFLGRISPEKRPDRAIRIALATGMKLKIAAKVDKVDEDYWKDHIEPLVRSNPGIEFVGEIGEDGKAEFLGNAFALLFPIDWPEPFGLVMIEAMSCGTPVVAFRCGSVPEVVDHGQTGLIVSSTREAVEAVGRVGELDRSQVRKIFERRFTAERMAADYVAIYRRLGAARTGVERVERDDDKKALQFVA